MSGTHMQSHYPSDEEMASNSGQSEAHQDEGGRTAQTAEAFEQDEGVATDAEPRTMGLGQQDDEGEEAEEEEEDAVIRAMEQYGKKLERVEHKMDRQAQATRALYGKMDDIHEKKDKTTQAHEKAVAELKNENAIVQQLKKYTKRIERRVKTLENEKEQDKEQIKTLQAQKPHVPEFESMDHQSTTERLQTAVSDLAKLQNAHQIAKDRDNHTTTVATSARIAQLENQVNELEKKVRAKDETIVDLCEQMQELRHQ